MSQTRKIDVSVFEILLFSIYFIFIGYVHFLNIKQLVIIDWARNDFDYCYLIPVVFICFFFKKRFKIIDTVSHSSWFGLIPICFGIMFLFFGELGGEYLVSYISLWLMIIGYFWIIWGAKKIRIVIFPFIFLLTMFPPPTYIYSRITLQMQLLSSRIAEALLYFFGVPVYREGNIIDIGSTKIQVVAACSGLRYLIPMLLVGFLMGYIMRTPRLGRKVLLCLLTIPLAVLMNGVRLALTAFLARNYGSWIIEGTYHEILGWFIFIVSIVFMFFMMHIMESKQIKTETGENKTVFDIKLSYSLKDILFTHSTLKCSSAIFLIAVSAIFLEYTQNVNHVLPQVKSMKFFPTTISGWEGVRSEIHPHILDELDVTDYVLADYVDDNGGQINFYVAYYASQAKGKSIHSPESCMRGAGWRFIETGVKKIVGGIKVNRSILANQNRQLVSYFWFPCRGRNLTNGIELKLYNFWDSLTIGRTDGALVRVITDSVDGRTEEADKRVLRFLKDVIPVLSTYLPNK